MKRSVAVGTLLAACGLPSGIGAQTLVKLIVASPPTDNATPPLYAIRAGIFRKYGLDVDLQQMNNGALIIAAALGGSIQIGTSNLFSLITAHAHGTPIWIVAPSGVVTEDSSYGVLIVKNGSPIQKASDLNGKMIGSAIAKGDLNTTATMAWIDKNGGDSSSIRIVEIPPSATLAALDEGRIDAATLQSPVSTMALESGRVHVLGKSYGAVAKRYLTGSWFASIDWATKNADTLQRYTRAVRESAAYTNAHHTETLPLIAEFMKVDPQVLAKSVRLNSAEYVDPRDIQPVIDVAVRYGVIDRTFDAQDLIDPNIPKPPRRT